jgi:hypothetical protein
MFLITRFTDRDMLMRFHWGLGIGHVYLHASKTSPIHESPIGEDSETDANLDAAGSACHGEENPESDIPELGTGNREDDDWDNATQPDADSDKSSNPSDEEIADVMKDTLAAEEQDFYD